MVKNMFTQMIYRIVFCVVSALACLLTLDYFTVIHGTDYFTFSDDFWLYCTNNPITFSLRSA